MWPNFPKTLTHDQSTPTSNVPLPPTEKETLTPMAEIDVED